jgi:hypothetical protein
MGEAAQEQARVGQHRSRHGCGSTGTGKGGTTLEQAWVRQHKKAEERQHYYKL